jgi:hypothetical protein
VRPAPRSQVTTAGQAPHVTTEKEFMGQVTDAAHLWGWSVYHTQFSKWSEAGWPDLALCRPPRLVMSELKSNSASARVTPDQQRWLDLLSQCRTLETYLWYPPVDDVMPILRQRPPTLPVYLTVGEAQALSRLIDDPEAEPTLGDQGAIEALRKQIRGER